MNESRNKIALTAVCLSALMLGLEITSIPSILPTLERVLSADFSQLQWIMNAYTIAMCSVLVAMGALADRFGRKRVFLVSITVFGIASLICGLATSSTLLIAARFLQGLSAAGMLACQVAILSNQFQSGSERGSAFAKWGVVFGLGLGFGPIVGGLIVAISSWNWVFLIHVLISLATFTLAKQGVKESSDPHAIRIDIGGMITLSLSVFALVYLITMGRESALDSHLAIGIVLTGMVSAFLFVLIETRVARPMFDFKAFRIRNFSGALIGAAGMNFSFWPFIIYFPIYLQSVLQYSSIAAGATVMAYTLPTIIMPPVAEKLLTKRGPGFVIPLGLFCIAAGFIAMRFVVTTEHTSWVTLLPGCILAGIGLGLTNTPVTNTATGSLPPERAGMASGMEFSARMISLAVNIAVMGFVLVIAVSRDIYRLLADKTTPENLLYLTDSVAAGNISVADSMGVSAASAREALTHGIGWVMTYGATAAFILGVLAVITFEKQSKH